MPALEPKAPLLPPDPLVKSAGESNPTHLTTPGWAQRVAKSLAGAGADAGAERSRRRIGWRRGRGVRRTDRRV